MICFIYAYLSSRKKKASVKDLMKAVDSKLVVNNFNAVITGEDRVYNPLKIEVFFHLNLIYLYTNINFTDKQKENPEKLYDILQSNKIIDAVVEAIPREEFCDLYDTLCETRDAYIEWNQSAAGMLSIIVDDLPKKAAAASELLSNFNTEDYKEVIRFAQAANADRPIPTLVE